MRALGSRFLHDLASGILAPLAEEVRSDSSLCLELRGTKINIYYRGGNLVEINEAVGGYRAKFDEEYFRDGKPITLPDCDIREEGDVDDWLEVSPYLKQSIDRYLAKVKGNDEREFQQLLVRENNVGRVKRLSDGTARRSTDGSVEFKRGSIARATDYFVCDIEYQFAISGRSPQFDLVAVHWPSEPNERKNAHNRRLVIVEMKYGDKTLKGLAGLHAHVEDANDFLSDARRVNGLKKDMIKVFHQKRRLGLMDCGKDLASFSDEKPILMFVLANHDPGSSTLRDVLATCPKSPNVDLRIVTSSFFGYGLYDQGVHTIDEAIWRLGDYIYKDLPRNAGPN